MARSIQQYKKFLDTNISYRYTLENNEGLSDGIIWYFLHEYPRESNWRVFDPGYPNTSIPQRLNREPPENLLFTLSVSGNRHVLGYLNRNNRQFTFYGFLPPGDIQDEVKQIMDKWFAVQAFSLEGLEYGFNHVVCQHSSIL